MMYLFFLTTTITPPIDGRRRAMLPVGESNCGGGKEKGHSRIRVEIDQVVEGFEKLPLREEIDQVPVGRSRKVSSLISSLRYTTLTFC